MDVSRQHDVGDNGAYLKLLHHPKELFGGRISNFPGPQAAKLEKGTRGLG